MKKIMIGALLVMGVMSLSATKKTKEPEMPDIEAQMKRSEKIEAYRAKKDVAWHKTEYNKTLKYLAKKKK